MASINPLVFVAAFAVICGFINFFFLLAIIAVLKRLEKKVEAVGLLSVGRVSAASVYIGEGGQGGNAQGPSL